MSVLTPYWFPVFTLIIGALLKGVFDLFADTRKNRAGREARADALKSTLLLKRAEFQRSTLMELQDLIVEVGRRAFAAYSNSVIHYGRTSRWEMPAIKGEDPESARQFRAQFVKILARVRDNQVRQIGESFNNACSLLLASSNPDAGEIRETKLMDLLEALQGRVGEVLRAIDDIEDFVLKDRSK